MTVCSAHEPLNPSETGASRNVQTGEQQAAADQQRLEDAPQARERTGRRRDEGEDAGDDQQRRGEETEVADARRDGCEAAAHLVDRPYDLTGPPGGGAEPDQPPGRAFASRPSERGQPAGERADERRHRFADIVERRPAARLAGVERDEHEEGETGRGRRQQPEPEPDAGEPVAERRGAPANRQAEFFHVSIIGATREE